MNTSTSFSTGAHTTLPRVNYYPPLIATLLAAALLFVVTAAIGTIAVLNLVSEVGRVQSEGRDFSLGVGFCGLVGIAILAGALYFFTAIVKGVRDLSAGVYYTRGPVAESRGIDDRKARNWLLVAPSYAGPDIEAATTVTDEQQAASVDRSQIVQPRFNPPPKAGPFDRTPELHREIDTGPKQGSYLSPDRISSRKETALSDAEEGDKPTTPHQIFRIDFASRVGLAPGEEVIIAHSRYLQHIYYIARLRNGEWEVHRNKALI
jgi:hypothetical protein